MCVIRNSNKTINFAFFHKEGRSRIRNMSFSWHWVITKDVLQYRLIQKHDAQVYLGNGW